MSDISIEHGVPVPEKGKGKPNPTNAVYPFAKMEVGDSFTTSRPTARHAAYNFGRRHGMKFKSQANGSEIRIWRVE